MDLVGAWLRQLLKAGTAAALVPVAMVAALVVVLVGAGGFGGLGSLGQLVSGPQVSPAERLAASDPATGGRDVAPVAPADSARPGPSATPARSIAPRPAPQTPDTTPRERGPTVDPGPDGDGVAPPPPLPPPPPPLPPPAPPPPAPARAPTLKERTQVLGDKLKDTVGDVGTAVQEIVDGLGQSLGRILDPP